MALFGHPLGLEDAPLKACRAALLIQQRVATAATEIEAKYGLRPQLRIGINTGPVIVGKVESGDSSTVTALGDAVNLASRLQALAEPGSVMLSHATHRLIEGMVEIHFSGEHQIKGKAEPQPVYRLTRIVEGATRFAAAQARGLSPYVGRERELDMLDRALADARNGLRIVDIVAEPGMGKSRLLHEFRQRVGKERAFILSGSCSPDGQQTPFLPLIEVVRGSFRISIGEAEKDVAQKLEMGLVTLGLHSPRNLGLLLHLLGLNAPEGALAGLDGVLIGLRTRELLQQLLEERCRLSSVVMLIEDLHWTDSVSEEIFGKIVGSQDKLRLLLVHTRRPEYAPPWLDHAVVSRLPLDALPTGDIRRLVQARLGGAALPETLAQQITEKAEGNPLFAEEIVSFLTERGLLRYTAGELDFNATAVAAALPGSVQSLLTARVDRLAPKDRALLQAASVIGRRFDPDLLAVVTGERDIDARLASMQALDLVRPDGKSGTYLFKHALVRDALYRSLLAEPRTSLHLRIAEEIERRSGNRLAEVAEVLAHHFNETGRADKGFRYLAMAGSKSLSVYSVDEASTHLTAALALLDNNPGCASDDQTADFIVSYTLLLMLCGRWYALVDVTGRYLPRIDRLGDDPRAVLIRHHRVFALIYNTRYLDAAALQRNTSEIAERLGDNRSKAYALAVEICVSTIIAPKPLPEFEVLKKKAMRIASDADDGHIRQVIQYAIACDEWHRGRMNEARDVARELIEVGRQSNNPRSTGFGLCCLSFLALVSDSYARALEYSEQALAVAVTPLDRDFATLDRGSALVLLGRTEEGSRLLDEHRRDSTPKGKVFDVDLADGIIGICKVLQGNIKEGIRLIEEIISKQEKKGYRTEADWFRIHLAEVYLQIIAGKEKPPLRILLTNLSILLNIMVTGPARIRAAVKCFMENPQFDRAGFHIGRAQMILGLLYKAKKKRRLAIEHLSEARRILSQFGETPVLARVETALSEIA
jgi:tetratricopeptide (TPR) repeat protein